METSLVKLQNLVLQYDTDANFANEYVALMHRPSNLMETAPVLYDPEEKGHIIKKNTYVDFSTYFNCLQLNNWKEHTNAANFKLKLIFKGKAAVEIVEIFKNSQNVNRNIILHETISSDEKTEVTLDIPVSERPLLGFAVTALEDFYIYEGAYWAEVPKEDVRSVRISLVSTTFRKEAYILKNMEMLRKKVLCEGSELADSLFVHVIDNGRTLDAEGLSGGKLKVYPNKNVGGAGGFSRGMIEALALDPQPDYVLLMDDDVLIIPESLFRTYYLLRILKPEYYDCFVSGAMFDYDIRELQYEDVGYVHPKDASYGPVKDRLDMRRLDSLLRNEGMGSRVRENSYAGWWYCCIPAHLIKENGLPLPVFVRGDDVEFSLRNKAKFLTLNGICIWHVGFAGKFNAAMELYQVHRNSFVFQATSGVCKDINFIRRMHILFWKEITRFSYDNAQQIVDAVADFMTGPEFLKNLDGEASIKAHGAMNEKYVPIETLPFRYNIRSEDPYSYKRLSLFSKAMYVLTINGHLLPGFLLRHQPEVIAYDWYFVPGKNFRRKRLIAVNPKDGTACIRTINRRRCFSLMRKYRKVMKNYKKNHAAVEAAYRNAFSEFTSEAFWKEYLGI